MHPTEIKESQDQIIENNKNKEINKIYKDSISKFFDLFIESLEKVHENDWSKGISSNTIAKLSFRDGYSFNDNPTLASSRYLFICNFPDQDPCLIGYMLKTNRSLDTLEITEVWHDMKHVTKYKLNNSNYKDIAYQLASKDWILNYTRVAIKFYNHVTYERVKHLENIDFLRK